MVVLFSLLCGLDVPLLCKFGFRLSDWSIVTTWYKILLSDWLPGILSRYTTLSLREMTIEQLKEVFKYSWNSYSQYFYLLEDKLSYYALRKWSKTLHWSHPAARRIDFKTAQT